MLCWEGFEGSVSRFFGDICQEQGWWWHRDHVHVLETHTGCHMRRCMRRPSHWRLWGALTTETVRFLCARAWYLAVKYLRGFSTVTKRMDLGAGLAWFTSPTNQSCDPGQVTEYLCLCSLTYKYGILILPHMTVVRMQKIIINAPKRLVPDNFLVLSLWLLALISIPTWLGRKGGPRKGEGFTQGPSVSLGTAVNSMHAPSTTPAWVPETCLKLWGSVWLDTGLAQSSRQPWGQNVLSTTALPGRFRSGLQPRLLLLGGGGKDDVPPNPASELTSHLGDFSGGQSSRSSSRWPTTTWSTPSRRRCLGMSETCLWPLVTGGDQGQGLGKDRKRVQSPWMSVAFVTS